MWAGSSTCGHVGSLQHRMNHWDEKKTGSQASDHFSQCYHVLHASTKSMRTLKSEPSLPDHHEGIFAKIGIEY